MMIEVSIIDDNPEFDVQVWNTETQEREEDLERTYETKQQAVDYVKTLINDKRYVVMVKDETAPVKRTITKDYLEDVLGNMSSSENLGASDKLSGLKDAVLAEIVLEERLPLDAFNFGELFVEPSMSVHLDENDIPTVIYDLLFFEIGVKLPIVAKHYSSWVYYPGKLSKLK